MKKFSKEEVTQMDKIDRLNLVNSVTGYKSANLIGSISKEGIENLAIFSSITHLGSNPALLGFIMRPLTVPRDTYKNIKETGYFTVNHITEKLIQKAHQTSANYLENVSEFEESNIESEYVENIKQPFVKESPVRLLCKYMSEYTILENGCIHIIASIEEIYFEEDMLNSDYWLQLEKGNVVAINGLDGYCLPKLLDRYEYARPNTMVKSMLKNGS
jgi:flavin reductase (DIM6/NTAB) family NADH-FMN oxidoreductase RutF